MVWKTEGEDVEGGRNKTRLEVRRMNEEFKVLQEKLSDVVCTYQSIKDLKNELEEIRRKEQERNKENEELKREMVKLRRRNELRKGNRNSQS